MHKEPDNWDYNYVHLFPEVFSSFLKVWGLRINSFKLYRETLKQTRGAQVVVRPWHDLITLLSLAFPPQPCWEPATESLQPWGLPAPTSPPLEPLPTPQLPFTDDLSQIHFPAPSCLPEVELNPCQK